MSKFGMFAKKVKKHEEAEIAQSKKATTQDKKLAQKAKAIAKQDLGKKQDKRRG